MAIGNIYVIAGVSVVGGALFGFDISSLSAQLGMQSYKCYFNEGPEGPPFNDNPDNCSGPKSLIQGGITASMSAGSWLGALVSGYLSDILGRKYSIMIGCVIWYVLFLPGNFLPSKTHKRLSFFLILLPGMGRDSRCRLATGARGPPTAGGWRQRQCPNEEIPSFNCRLASTTLATWRYIPSSNG
jgi:MFS family permease